MLAELSFVTDFARFTLLNTMKTLLIEAECEDVSLEKLKAKIEWYRGGKIDELRRFLLQHNDLFDVEQNKVRVYLSAVDKQIVNEKECWLHKAFVDTLVQHFTQELRAGQQCAIAFLYRNLPLEYQCAVKSHRSLIRMLFLKHPDIFAVDVQKVQITPVEQEKQAIRNIKKKVVGKKSSSPVEQAIKNEVDKKRPLFNTVANLLKLLHPDTANAMLKPPEGSLDEQRIFFKIKIVFDKLPNHIRLLTTRKTLTRDLMADPRFVVVGQHVHLESIMRKMPSDGAVLNEIYASILAGNVDVDRLLTVLTSGSLLRIRNAKGLGKFLLFHPDKLEMDGSGNVAIVNRDNVPANLLSTKLQSSVQANCEPKDDKYLTNTIRNLLNSAHSDPENSQLKPTGKSLYEQWAFFRIKWVAQKLKLTDYKQVQNFLYKSPLFIVSGQYVRLATDVPAEGYVLDEILSVIHASHEECKNQLQVGQLLAQLSRSSKKRVRNVKGLGKFVLFHPDKLSLDNSGNILAADGKHDLKSVVLEDSQSIAGNKNGYLCRRKITDKELETLAPIYDLPGTNGSQVWSLPEDEDIHETFPSSTSQVPSMSSAAKKKNKDKCCVS